MASSWLSEGGPFVRHAKGRHTPLPHFASLFLARLQLALTRMLSVNKICWLLQFRFMVFFWVTIRSNNYFTCIKPQGFDWKKLNPEKEPSLWSELQLYTRGRKPLHKIVFLCHSIGYIFISKPILKRERETIFISNYNLTKEAYFLKSYKTWGRRYCIFVKYLCHILPVIRFTLNLQGLLFISKSMYAWYVYKINIF